MKFRTPIIIKIKFQNPFIPKWKQNMIDFAREGKALGAVKEIKIGLNCSIKEAKDLWDNKYRGMYYKRP